MTQTGATRASAAFQDLKEQVALANRLLHHYGLATYMGHVSARVPGTDRMVIKARPSVSMDRVQARDLMVMDLEGHIVEASPEYPTPVAEWPLHAAVYQARPEVGSVVHTHQKWCTVLGIAGRPVLPVQHAPTASVAAEPWPVYEESAAPVSDVTQARVVARTLGQAVACHLRNQGMVFLGTNVERAVRTAVDAESTAELTWRAMLIGTPETVPMIYMRDEVEGRFVPSEDEVRDGVPRGEWGNHVWLDENLDAARNRGIQL